MKKGEYLIKANCHGFYSVEDIGDKLIRDKNGILKYKIPYTTSYEYYPVYIAEQALANCVHSPPIFWNNIEWLMKNKKQRKDMIVWEHHYELPAYNFFSMPWVHGMAQGLIVSAMLRAYANTKDKKYLETAEGAYNVFEHHLGEGGVMNIIGDDMWLEEYEIKPPAQILNGFIFIIFGIYELWLVTGKKKYEDKFNKAIKTLKNNLYKYDYGFWSRYNLLHEHPAPMLYHNLHIKQMEALYHITQDYLFMQYAERWEQCRNSFIKFRMAQVKRLKIHLKTHGVIGCIEKLLLSRRKA